MSQDHKPCDKAVYMVASIIVDRWTRAGIRSFMYDADGFPVPALADLAHDVREAPTPPHKSQLFFCARCAYAKTPLKVPPRGVCEGINTRMIVGDVIEKMLLGGRYDVDAHGLPIPAKSA